MNILNLSFIIFFQCYFGCDHQVETNLFSNNTSQQKQSSSTTAVSNVIFQSKDGGKSWQNISEGLPENIQGDGLFVDEKGMYLSAGKIFFHSKPNTATPTWKKETLLLENGTLTKTSGGLLAFNYQGQFFQRMNASSLWLPVYTNFQKSNVRAVFESSEGHVFIGCDSGLYKSTDAGKNWKLVHNDGWVIKIVESEGVLIATNQSGIIRSSDSGEHWDLVISEHGVGIDAEIIKGGFAVITYNEESKTRRIRSSYDGGKTWDRIDAGLPPQASISSILQAGENFYCGHPDGIFQSTDKGKSWKLTLPSIGKKVFNLKVLDNVIYAIPRYAGC